MHPWMQQLQQDYFRTPDRVTSKKQNYGSTLKRESSSPLPRALSSSVSSIRYPFAQYLGPLGRHNPSDLLGIRNKLEVASKKTTKQQQTTKTTKRIENAAEHKKQPHVQVSPVTAATHTTIKRQALDVSTKEVVSNFEIKWVPSTPQEAFNLANKAVVAGYDAPDGSPLWIIRTMFENDLTPGKLITKQRVAFVPWGGKENVVTSFEVLCARPEDVHWVETHDGVLPPKAIVAGNTSAREPLYIGRAKHEGSLTPGKVHPSHKMLYISFGGQEVALKSFEVLCSVK